MKQNIITLLQKNNIVGRGGACFPTALKWQLVKKSKGKRKIVIVNASEGELGLFKDIYILEKYLDQVFIGLQTALVHLNSQEAYFNLNKDYYQKIKKPLAKLIAKYQEYGYKIVVYEEEPSYIGGEETTLLNSIEGKRRQPRIRPPYPAQSGLFGCPTLVQNVETLFDIAQVVQGKYEKKRFYCLSGKIKKSGVFHLSSDISIAEVLKTTNNYPKFPFIVQIGGSASGLVLRDDQLADQKMIGAGSIEVYPLTIKPYELLYKWFDFYQQESCGHCTPCRLGSYQLFQQLKRNKEINWEEVLALVNLMEKTSFCGLGTSIAQSVKSYYQNVVNYYAV